jgi:hypothetical protein
MVHYQHPVCELHGASRTLTSPRACVSPDSDEEVGGLCFAKWRIRLMSLGGICILSIWGMRVLSMGVTYRPGRGRMVRVTSDISAYVRQ